jgi:hypothetical protein
MTDNQFNQFNQFNQLKQKEDCRICLQEDNIKNLISPCLCRGSNKYIHRECLNQWRRLSDNQEQNNKCPTCKFEYHIETINVDNCKCFSTYSSILSKSLCNLICFNFLLMLLLSLIIYNINGQEEIINETLTIYNLSLLIIVGIFLLFFVISYFRMRNKKIINKYYLKYKIGVQIFSLLLGCLMLFILPIIGFLLICFFLNTIMRIHMIVIDSVNMIDGGQIVSLSDEQIIALRV